jgi:choline dehydrogenase-like flavoprotein
MRPQHPAPDRDADFRALRFDLARGRIDRRAALQMAMAAGMSLAAGAELLAATRAPLRVKSTTTSDIVRRRVDFIIVGGGTAGCVLAHRLSADRGVNVVVLEAGGWPTEPLIDAPGAWPALQGGAYDRKYQTVPQRGLDGRALPCPRGLGYGGSSLLNAMGHQRGHAKAYDRWAALGATGWSAAQLLPYHRRSETYSGGSDAWRGGTGPLDVLAVAARRGHPVAQAFLDSAREMKFAWSDDFNGRTHGQAAWNQFTIGAGHVREHGARAYLEPIAERPNLELLADAPVLRLDVARGQCRGVTYLHGGRAVELVAERGVIMAAGAIDTPRLLMLSGLGPAAALRSLGIDVAADLPGIGQDLHDHPLVGGIAYQATKPVPVSGYNHGEGMLFANVNAGDVPDLLIMSVTVPFVIPTVGTPPPDCYTLIPCVMQPRSRGTVRLASADPAAAAIIDPATYSDPADLETMVSGIEMAREVAAQPALREWSLREAFPGPQVTTRAGLREFVKRGTSPFYHPVGTARMGSDAAAPVTPDLRVRGVGGLWVADASVMPRIVPAMTNAATVAIAERGSDLIAAAAR